MKTLRGLALRAIAAALLVTACASPYGRTGMETFGRGVMNLALSPLMIVAGLAQGLAFLPYTIGLGLNELNQGLLQANAVSLDDSYKATYGVSINDKNVHKQTGEVFGQDGIYGRFKPEALAEANHAFQRLLVSQGMPETTARNYAVVGNYKYAWSQDRILVAVVYRHVGNAPFRVTAKETNIATTFRPEQRGWYEAYPRDASGAAIDEVIDWAALEYSSLRSDKVVATLMAIAAESVKSGKRAPDFWEAEKRWLAGDTTSVMQSSTEKVRRALPS
jgi:hypothetical protein